MNITINARHMDATDALKEYAEQKVAKLPKYFDNIHTIEVILDVDGGQPAVEIIAQATKKLTFVAHAREEDMYAGIDHCVDKVSEQIRRHKDKVRDRKAS